MTNVNEAPAVTSATSAAPPAGVQTTARLVSGEDAEVVADTRTTNRPPDRVTAVIRPTAGTGAGTAAIGPATGELPSVVPA